MKIDRRGSKQHQWQTQLNKLWNKPRSGIERTIQAHQTTNICRHFGDNPISLDSFKIY